MATAQQQGRPGLEPDGGAGRRRRSGSGPGVDRRLPGVLPGRPDTDIPYREETSAANRASWRVCARPFRGGHTTAAGGAGGEETR